MQLRIAIAIVIAAFAGFVPCHSAACPEMVGRWGYGTTEAITANATHLYAGFGTYLQIYSLADPSHPNKIAELMLAGQVRGITLAEIAGKQYAFVAGSRAGLIIVDVSNPAVPMVAGSIDTPHFASDVVIQGDLAYVADFDMGSWSGNFSELRIIDIHDVAHPTDIGNMAFNAVKGVAVSGNYAYLATYDGLRIVDVSNPRSPCERGAFLWQGFAENVEIRSESGGHLLAYVCDFGTGLWVIDVTDPGSPSLEGRFDWYAAYDISFVGSIACIAAYFDGFVTVDITDPASPIWIGSIETTERIEGVAVPNGDFAYLADFSGIMITDLRNPSWPVESARYPTGDVWGTVAADSSIAYIAGAFSGVKILEFSEAANPKEIGYYNSHWYALGLAKIGNLLYVADSTGVASVDISNPAAPQELSYLETSCQAMAVAAAGNYVYLACSYGGLRIIDATDPFHLFEAGYIETPVEALGLYMYRNYVLIADWTGGIRIVDVSNPTRPRDVWQLTGYNAHDLAVSNNKAYVADPVGFLIVIDLEDPENPHMLGSIVVPGNPTGIAARGDIVFVAAWDAGWLRAYDVSDPAAIQELGYVETPGSPYDLALSGDVLVASDAGAGVTFHRVDGCGFNHQRPLTKP